MSEEEKYKLALFMVVRNNAIMPKGIELGKSEKEINQMSVSTVKCIMQMCDFGNLEKKWKDGGGE